MKLILISENLISSKKYNWEIQATESKFSNFALSEDKKTVISTDESGDLHLIDLKTGNIIKHFSGLNVDNVFQVDYKSGVIATAGQDRRCAVFLKDGSRYYKNANFLIYSVGISPDGSIIGFANDEQNNVTIFNSKTKENLLRLVKNKATISNILFLNNNEVFVGCDTNELNYYKYK